MRTIFGARRGAVGPAGANGSNGSNGAPGTNGADAITLAFVSARYSGNANYSGAEVVVTNWTEDADTANAFNPTTGIFTAPANGHYTISAWFELNEWQGGTQIPSIAIAKNSIVVARRRNGWDRGNSISAAIYLAAYDTAEVRIRSVGALNTVAVENGITILGTT